MDGLSEFISSGPGILSVGGLTFAVGWLLFSADRRIEDRRRRALELATMLKGIGFQKLPAIFVDYGVGDYSGVLRGVHELHDILAEPGQREAELAKVFQLLLEEKLKDPTKLATLKQFVDRAAEALASGNPLAAAEDLSAKLLAVVKSGALGNELLTSQLPQSGLSAIFDKPEVKGLISKVGEYLTTKDASASTPAA